MSEIETEIKKIFFEIFPELNESNFDWKKSQRDYDDWDSFSQLNLLTLVESKFNIAISDNESISIQSAEDLLNVVKRHKCTQ